MKKGFEISKKYIFKFKYSFFRVLRFRLNQIAMIPEPEKLEKYAFGEKIA
jgi:hypothetical protein